jgi:hypothetical protein
VAGLEQREIENRGDYGWTGCHDPSAAHEACSGRDDNWCGSGVAGTGQISFTDDLYLVGGGGFWGSG